MRIEIHYQRCSDTAPQVTTLTPELYFDPLEHGETYEESGIPKYNHAVDYLPFAADELKWTELLVVESGSDYTIRTEFYGPGALMWHRKDSDGGCVAKIIIRRTIVTREVSLRSDPEQRSYKLRLTFGITTS